MFRFAMEFKRENLAYNAREGDRSSYDIEEREDGRGGVCV